MCVVLNFHMPILSLWMQKKIKNNTDIIVISRPIKDKEGRKKKCTQKLGMVGKIRVLVP